MRINQIMLVGIALIIVGVVAFAYPGITYTSRENVVNLGPIQANVSNKEASSTANLDASYITRPSANFRSRCLGKRSRSSSTQSPVSRLSKGASYYLVQSDLFVESLDAFTEPSPLFTLTGQRIYQKIPFFPEDRCGTRLAL